jgi:hypothetical protein
MLKDWNNLINTDCVVVDIGEVTVYPIFRNGSTSLFRACDRRHINDQIKDCENIEILIRNPDDRFISGINMYSEQNDLSVEETWSKARQGTLVDRHFCPQYIWLLHLYKFYRGTVTLRKFEHIKALTSIHRKKSKTKKKQVPILKNFVAVDHELMGSIDRPTNLKNLLERYKHVLS